MLMGKLTKLDDDVGPSQDGSSPDRWPRRLLHVSSMTSHERKANNTYAGVAKPSYNAISYTWGRFQDKSSTVPAIDIKGVTWRIPSVKLEHFTRDEFHLAIKRAAENQDFLWLDVACIDQQDEVVKMDEINRQAAIFKGAKHVYAWMTPWATDQMLRSMHILTAFNASLGWPDLGYRLKPAVQVGVVDRTSLHAAVKDISSQGWFTSLWTLQEAWLSSPYIMSRSADTVNYVYYSNGKETSIATNRPVSLNWITGEFSKVWRALLRDRTAEARSICDMIVDSGVISIDTREDSLLYCAAAKRQHRRPQDAVYGIMQVYDIQMPARRDVERLLNDFALLLNARHPISTQLFVHRQPVEPSKSWRVSRDTSIPLIFRLEPLGDKVKCRIEAGAGQRPMFTGNAIAANDLFDFWAVVQRQRRDRSIVPFLPHIYLDASESTPCQYIRVHDPDSAPAPAYWQALEDSETVAFTPKDVPSLFPLPLRRYRVLYLGTKRNCPFNVAEPNSNEQWDFNQHIGLLVVQPGKGEKGPWNRVGYCSWMAESQVDVAPPQGQTVVSEPDVIETPSTIWQSAACYLA